MKSYSDYLAESLDKNIEYSEYLAENLESNINYAEYVAQALDEEISYSDYLASDDYHIKKKIEEREAKIDELLDEDSNL